MQCCCFRQTQTSSITEFCKVIQNLRQIIKIRSSAVYLKMVEKRRQSVLSTERIYCRKLKTGCITRTKPRFRFSINVHKTSYLPTDVKSEVGLFFYQTQVTWEVVRNKKKNLKKHQIN